MLLSPQNNTRLRTVIIVRIMHSVFEPWRFVHFILLSGFLDSSYSLFRVDDVKFDRHGNDAGLSWDAGEGRCPLNPLGTYPYLAKIFFVSDVRLYIRTAAILSHKAVLSHCTSYPHYSAEQLTVTVQRRVSQHANKLKFCIQTRRVVEMVAHPRCQRGEYKYDDHRLYDYLVLVLDRQFEAEEGYAYPVLPIPNQPVLLAQLTRKLTNMNPKYCRCEVPVFLLKNIPHGLLPTSSGVTLLEKKEDCWIGICILHEYPPKCIDEMQHYMKDSYFCITTDNQKKYDYSTSLQYHYGTPIVCNNTAFGQVTQNIYRRKFDTDLLLISTYLRVWPWLMEQKEKFWNDSWNRHEWDGPLLDFSNLRHPGFIITPRRNKTVINKNFRHFKFVVRDKTTRSRGNQISKTFAIRFVIALITIICNM